MISTGSQRYCFLKKYHIVIEKMNKCRFRGRSANDKNEITERDTKWKK